MKNSLAKQIVAINKEVKRKERQLQTLADGRLTQALAKDYKRIKRDKERLNDAASTIAAVNLIGADTIKLLPSLIKASEDVCNFYHKENTWPISELNKLISQLKK